MIKKISKVGNSQGIIFDQAIMELARLKVGDEVNVTIHAGGSITLTPMRPEISPEDVTEAINEVMDDYSDTMQKLA